jgi:hypothetical protein
MLIEYGVAEALIGLLRTQSQLSDVNVLMQICSTLTNIASTDDRNRRALGQAGAIEAVVEVTSVHGQNADLVMKAAGTILKLVTKDAENSVRAGRSGVCEAVVGALKLHGAVETQVFNLVCKVIIELAAGNEANCDKMVTSGASDAILFSLRIQKISRDEEVYENLKNIGLAAVQALLSIDMRTEATSSTGTQAFISASPGSGNTKPTASAPSAPSASATSSASASVRTVTPPPPPSAMVGTVAAPRGASTTTSGSQQQQYGGQQRLQQQQGNRQNNCDSAR